MTYVWDLDMNFMRMNGAWSRNAIFRVRTRGAVRIRCIGD